MKKLFFLAFLALNLSVNAQSFLKNTSSTPFGLKDLQVQFNAFKTSHDLKKIKHWKYIKRYEMEMSLHTDAKGNLPDPSIYINEAIKISNEKKGKASKLSSTGWYPVGPSTVPNNLTGYMMNGVGRINCIAFHPTDPATFFVGVAQGGVWKTNNNGQSWTPLTDNLPITRISDISIDPKDPKIMYISVCDFEYIGVGLYLNGRKRSTHYGLGVYKTIDGGSTWEPTGLSFKLTDGDASLIRKVVVNKNNTDKLVACGVSGMYTSGDAGKTWVKRVDSLFWDLAQDPTDINTLYAAGGWVQTANDGYAAVYKSTDFGTSWTMLNTSIPGTGTVQRVKLAIAPSDNNYIYALTVDKDGGLYGIYKSTDAGVNWNYINPGVNILEGNDGTNPGGQGNYDLAFNVNAANKNLVYVGGVNLWGSNDGAQTFSPIGHWTTSYGPSTHGDFHFIEQQPLTGNYFACSDGGIYRSANLVLGSWTDANNGTPWPTQWTNISNGLAISSFYRLSSSKNLNDKLLAGAQDNASFYFNGTTWSTIFGGDGMDNYINPDDNTLVGSSQYGSFMLSTDEGHTSFPVSANFDNQVAEWTSPLIADYKQNGTLYAGFGNVSRSTDGGNSWNYISNFPQNPLSVVDNEVSALAVSNSNSNVIYAAKRVRYEFNTPGSLYKTIDGGNNWADITAGLPDSLYYTSVELSEKDENTAYIGLGGLKSGLKVFRTINGGQTWQNISYNLPNMPVNCVKYIPGTNNIIVATDLGLFVLENGSTTWLNKSVGLPNVILSDIEFNQVSKKVYVSTFGRGIWGCDLREFTTSGIADNNALLKFELFPTVNKGTFNIKFPSENSLVKLTIIDVTGKEVFKDDFRNQSQVNPHLNLPAGMYYARISSGEKTGVKKFIIE